MSASSGVEVNVGKSVEGGGIELSKAAETGAMTGCVQRISLKKIKARTLKTTRFRNNKYPKKASCCQGFQFGIFSPSNALW